MNNLPIHTGGGTEEIKITTRTFPGIKIIPIETVNFNERVLALVTFVIECRIMGGYDLLARISRTTPGIPSMLTNVVVLTTSRKYETRSHMSSFVLEPGPHEVYLECCVGGGTGYMRYHCYTTIFSAL